MAWGPLSVWRVSVESVAGQQKGNYLRFLPAILGLIGFGLSGWVFFDYSLQPLLQQSLFSLSTLPMDAIWALAAVGLGASLWVFTELE